MKTPVTLIVLIICVACMHAQIINIPADHSTIQAGIDAAGSGDTVLVSDGTYKENIRFNGKAVTLASKYIQYGDTSHIRNTIIDGNSPLNLDTASTIYMGDVPGISVICGLTITGGYGTIRPGKAGRVGGGLYINNSACTIEQCIIANNDINYNFSVVSGGGIYANIGTGNDLIIKNCTIRDNDLLSFDKATGAGISIWAANENNCTILIEGNTISGNTATSTLNKNCQGGGIAYTSILPTKNDGKINNNIISNNELHSNSNQTLGGAILVLYFEVGGYYNDDNPTPVISNNIITGNTISPGGGSTIGIWTQWASQTWGGYVTPQPLIVNNTVTENVSGGVTGLFNWRSYPVILNSIFWNSNADPNALEINNASIYGTIYAINNNIKGGLEGYSGSVVDENNINVEVNFSEGTCDLSDTSYCIGRGATSVVIKGHTYEVPVSDFNDNDRPNSIDPWPDMGAIESVHARPPTRVYEYINLPLEIYPNPAQDIIHIDSNLPVASFEMFEVNGPRILNVLAPDGQISIGHLREGLYLIRLTTDRGDVYTGKVIKQ